MNLKNISIMTCLVALLALVNASSFIAHYSEINLLNFMARSNALLQQDPARSLDCFNYYIPKINEIAKNYETNFKACVDESLVARAKADNSTLNHRNDLANASQTSCALLSQCNEDESVEEIFQCYINVGTANIKTMYDINANASQKLAALREQYFLIAAQENRCTNETKQIYEQDSAAAYASLNSCILGNSEIPTEVSPTIPTEQPTTQPQQKTSEVSETAELSTTESSSESLSVETDATTLESEYVTGENIPSTMVSDITENVSY